MIETKKPAYNQKDIYEIEILQRDNYTNLYKFWTMVSTNGHEQVAWMPYHSNDSIHPQIRRNKTPVTVRNLKQSDVEKMIKEIATTASHVPKSKLNLNKILKNNKDLVERITKDIKIPI